VKRFEVRRWCARGAVVAGAAARRWRARAASVASAGAQRWRSAIAAARDLVATYPRHLLLAALVAGLLMGPRWALALAATALLALALARTTGVALGALAALVAGAGFADARLGALDRSALAPLLDRTVNVRATLLEHPRTRRFGTRVVAARLLSQPGRGERVLIRVPSRVRWPTSAGPGSELILRGRLTALGLHDAHERRRNAHALLRAHVIRLTGRRRNGLSGALDTVRGRTERALSAGAPAAQAALARGMVLGQDAALPDDLREDFRVTGLAHLVAASGANVLQLAARRRLRRIASDAGQILRAGPFELRVLWPQRTPAAPPGAEPNDRATVLHVRDGAFDLLLTADAESNVTAALDLPVVEALKVAHHGSDDPGLPGLLQRLRPQIAVIEVGAHNTYGHPTPATLAALRAVPIVRRTDRDGTVRVRVRDERIVVQSVS
jgi:hypothetical protein